MENLILNSLMLHNFRGFKDLQIEQLGRVNLIVGKNNVGKSSFLEALQIYAENGNPNLIWKILQARDEGRLSRNRLEEDQDLSKSQELEYLRHLFHGRQEIARVVEPIVIGPLDSPDDTLSISIGWYERQHDEEGTLKFRLLQPDEYEEAENITARFTIETGKLSISQNLRSNLPRRYEKKTAYIPIAPNGLDNEAIGALWDTITLTELEIDVIKAMRILAPGIERISIIGKLDSKDRLLKGVLYNREREVIPVVKVEGTKEPIALRSLGDGMQRVFGLALALVNMENGILLIDEIENGLHYSVQLAIWQLIFQLAHRLNVQVFATTHSWDCINAFQKAAQENAQREGLLIRLQNKKGEISAVSYEEEELAIAIREDIEVR